MSITYDKNSKIFNISTKNTSYMCGLVEDGALMHIFYGKKVKELKTIKNYVSFECRATAAVDLPELNISTDNLPQEYPCFGTGDLRSPALHATYEDGSTITTLRYKSHEIVKGKPELSGLPATYVENDREAETLIITMADALTELTVNLYYTAFNEFDAIARHAEIINNGKSIVKINKALSMNIDFYEMDYDFVHLYGSWAKERIMQKSPLINGNVMIESRRGASSHHHNPFFALTSKNATENSGDAYGFNLVYSGNFTAGVETDTFNVARAYMGINPMNFCWELAPGEAFVTPEAVMVYSDCGLGKMSRTFHKLYRTRLARGKYRDAKRPVLLNNWEATYFDFTEDKIINIAKKAKEVGVELMVLDDGWFGKRNDSTSSLGDWFVNEEKLPDGIKGLAEKINEMGLKFGLWFEPEMISPNSDLYRAHPDWCLHVQNRTRSTSRNQLMLDLSRKDVREYIVKVVSDVLKSANISYVKWDYNRNMSEVGSALLPANKQGEVYHRYILGLYEVLEEITTSFPDILFESCSGGGGRFDCGMMHYMPQCWTSDDTDAIERLYIQHGTSLVYPLSFMGAHVSAVPNHQTHRTTSINMRGDVAMFGRFGYELDLATLTDEELQAVKEQIIKYHKLEDIIHKGDMYRIKSPYEGSMTCWEVVSEDKDYVVMGLFSVMSHVQEPYFRIKLEGLCEDSVYIDTETNEEFDGDALMNIGLSYQPNTNSESIVKVFKKKN